MHGLRCYGNITRTRNVSEYILVLALCLVVVVVVVVVVVLVVVVVVAVVVTDIWPYSVWLGSLVDRALYLRLDGRQFDSRPPRLILDG